MIFEMCPLLSDIPWLVHGFYGRDTAVTNVVTGKQDFPDVGQTLFLPQKHTDIVVMAGDALPENGADASIAMQEPAILAVKTADCVPLLMVCTKTKTIAAVHAGWPGALNGITTKTVEKMVGLGAEPSSTIAALGPSIQQETYEVGDDLRDKFVADNENHADFFKPMNKKFCLDVPGIISRQLQNMGVTRIWQSKINTYTSPDHYSYRRSNIDPANEIRRNVSVIGYKVC